MNGILIYRNAEGIIWVCFWLWSCHGGTTSSLLRISYNIPGTELVLSTTVFPSPGSQLLSQDHQQRLELQYESHTVMPSTSAAPNYLISLALQSWILWLLLKPASTPSSAFRLCLHCYLSFDKKQVICGLRLAESTSTPMPLLKANLLLAGNQNTDGTPGVA